MRYPETAGIDGFKRNKTLRILRSKLNLGYPLLAADIAARSPAPSNLDDLCIREPHALLRQSPHLDGLPEFGRAAQSMTIPGGDGAFASDGIR